MSTLFRLTVPAFFNIIISQYSRCLYFLDLGIPVCFYEGIWKGLATVCFSDLHKIMADLGSVVVLSRWFNSSVWHKWSKSFSYINWYVLLSYSKMLHAIISTLHFQIIYHYSNDSIKKNRNVLHWKLDASKM